VHVQGTPDRPSRSHHRLEEIIVYSDAATLSGFYFRSKAHFISNGVST